MTATINLAIKLSDMSMSDDQMKLKENASELWGRA
jgi:hypothetical protein